MWVLGSHAASTAHIASASAAARDYLLHLLLPAPILGGEDMQCSTAPTAWRAHSQGALNRGQGTCLRSMAQRDIAHAALYCGGGLPMQRVQ